MKRFFWLYLCAIVCGLSATSYFDYVPDQVNFADYHYVGSHNAHVYQRFFKTVFQHQYDIKTQLESGIRGLMLDDYLWNESALNPLGFFGVRPNVRYGNGYIVMSHGEPGFIAFTQKGFTGCCKVEYQTYKYELRTIIDFLQANPTEVVIVCLEQHVPINMVVQETQEVMQEVGVDIVFTPQDWNPVQPGVTDHVWPTLGWMRAHNKRLIIFHSNPRQFNTTLTWDTWRYNTENRYGILDDTQQLSQERGESRDDGKTVIGQGRTLSIFNHIASLAITRMVSDVRNDHLYTKVKYLYGAAIQNGFAHGRIPNGYYGDRIIESVQSLQKDGIKTVFDLVNEINYAIAHDIPLI